MALVTFLEIYNNHAVKICKEVSIALISVLSSNICKLEEVGEISSVADVLEYLDSMIED